MATPAHIGWGSSLFLCLALNAMAQDATISGKEIQESWVGKTLIGTTSGGAPVAMKLMADGTATLSVGRNYDTGTWRIDENGYCTTWKTIRAGQERCFTTRKAGTGVTVLNPDGSVSGQFHEIR